MPRSSVPANRGNLWQDNRRPAASDGTRNPPAFPFADDLSRQLKKAVRGEVRFDGGDRAMYAYDASIFRQVPIGVVLPRDADDVEAALKVCRGFDVPVLGRGCGTALNGQSVNAGVVFGFTRHMDRIVELDARRGCAGPARCHLRQPTRGR